MDDFEELHRQYEKSMENLPSVKDTLSLLREFREIGIARGSNLKPFQSRQTLGDLQPGKINQRKAPLSNGQ